MAFTAVNLEPSRNAARELGVWFFTRFGDDPLTIGPHDHSDGHHGDYELFRKEDTTAWIVFTIVFFILVIFDNAILHRKQERISFHMALIYTVFWIGIALCFNVYVYYMRGFTDAVDWFTGYVLEWMLSVDNLFVFHKVFESFWTPDEQKHKPLFWGIVGAIVFRMLFFCVEEMLMHSIWWMHIIFGLFLIYTGIKQVASDDELPPEKQPLFLWLQKFIPFVNRYDAGGRFFVRVPVDPVTGKMITRKSIRTGPRRLSERRGTDRSRSASPSVMSGRGTATTEPGRVSTFTDGGQDTSSTSMLRDFAQECTCLVGNRNDNADSLEPMYTADSPEDGAPERVVYKWRATLLLLVVICLETVDIIFAVDSVSAIVAQIPDLFLAYTACVFAMLGLRATFFIIDELVMMFSLLNYGIALILVFIGLKLILRSWIHIQPWIVCCILMTTLVGSMICSVIHDKYWPEEEEQEKSTKAAP